MAASHKNTITQTPNLFSTKSHKHSLELKNYHKPYTCNGCKENGFGPRYRCEKCDFDLHNHCMFPQLSPTSHEFFPNSIFKFLKTPPKACHEHCKRRCDACRRPINGFVYHCPKEDLDLHPCCRKLERKYRIGELEFNLHKRVKDKCLWCNKRNIKDGGHSNGWCYISKCRKYHVHVGCVKEMILEQWDKTKHYVHKSLAFKNVNFKEIQGTRNGSYGKSGNMYWTSIKVFVKIIVSIVVGDPTMVFASLFLQLFG